MYFLLTFSPAENNFSSTSSTLDPLYTNYHFCHDIPGIKEDFLGYEEHNKVADILKYKILRKARGEAWRLITSSYQVPKGFFMSPVPRVFANNVLS